MPYVWDIGNNPREAPSPQRESLLPILYSRHLSVGWTDLDGIGRAEPLGQA